ncbi:MAG: polymorphic toxin-type HINT domain-containing protein, partial [bacterium]
MRIWLLAGLLWGLLADEAMARGGGGCLEAGTAIVTPDGSRPIEQLRPGDAVVSVRSGRLVADVVADVYEVDPAEYIEVEAGDHRLRLTPEHPVAVGEGIFVAAAALTTNDLLVVPGATARLPVSRITRIPAERKAFNLLVARTGVFIANGVLVHNKGCFLTDTPILRGDGTTVSIASIQPGERVLAFDPQGVMTTATVQNVITHEVEVIVELTAGPAQVRVTPEHPFYVGEGRFRTVEALRPGDRVFLCDGQGLHPETITRIERRQQDARVYNLQTDQPHTFFASGFAVHNKGGGCLEAGTAISTPDGLRAIEQLRPGDAVLAVQGGRLVADVVADVYEVDPAEYIEVEAGDHRLRLTPEHPVAVGEGIFVAAAALTTNDLLVVPGATARLPVSRITRIPAERKAFNLLVARTGVFIANGVLVHNKGCFLPDTPILRGDGTTVSIASIQPGERVLAFDPQGVMTTATVQNVITHEVEEIVELAAGSAQVRVTPEHPFYVGEGRFRTVEALRPGDRVFLCDGQGLHPETITRIERRQQNTRVYNLQTDQPHTFFANGFAVHNKGGGGGHRSSSHRSSSSSGSSSGGGGGTEDPTPIFMVIGGIVIFVVICKVIAAKQAKDANLDYCYSAKAVAGKAAKTAKLLEFLARQDPMMRPADLRQTAQSIFCKLQACWTARDYGPMQPLLMADLYGRHVQQLAGMKRNHEINVLDNLQVLRIDLVHVRYLNKPDQCQFTGLITARARDYYKDDRTGNMVRGDQTAATFQEFWTFQRQGTGWKLREVEQTRESDALKDENFVEMFTDQQVRQVYAEAATAAAGPAGPWAGGTLETKATRTERLLNFLAQIDKHWDREAMLEHARQVFTRVQMAQESGELAAVVDDLFPDVAADLQAKLQERKREGLRTEFRNFCVRKVEIILVRNYNDNGSDEYTTRISAHAQVIVRRADGSEARHDDDVA